MIMMSIHNDNYTAITDINCNTNAINNNNNTYDNNDNTNDDSSNDNGNNDDKTTTMWITITMTVIMIL